MDQLFEGKSPPCSYFTTNAFLLLAYLDSKYIAFPHSSLLICFPDMNKRMVSLILPLPSLLIPLLLFVVLQDKHDFLIDMVLFTLLYFHPWILIVFLTHLPESHIMIVVGRWWQKSWLHLPRTKLGIWFMVHWISDLLGANGFTLLIVVVMSPLIDMGHSYLLSGINGSMKLIMKKRSPLLQNLLFFELWLPLP